MKKRFFVLSLMLVLICAISFGTITVAHAEEVSEPPVATETIETPTEELTSEELKEKLAEAIAKINELTSEEIESSFKGVPSFELKLDEKILDILVNNNIASSRREAREFLTNNSITVNGEKITDENKIITKEDLLYEKYLIIRKGKKKYFIGIRLLFIE